MRISELLDERRLTEHLRNGLVSARRHSRLSLTIYNYTPQCMFANHWDDVTEQCRGLIVNDAGRVIARPFRKFFNLNTSFRPETHEANLPLGPPEVTDKLDGSLGILWQYDGEVGIATRGAFESEQAIWATRWFQDRFGDGRALGWPEDHTPLFEIVYKSNRIVVDYGEQEGLFLLGLINNQTGGELAHVQLTPYSAAHGLAVVAGFNKSLAECVAEQRANSEGYVLCWRSTRPPLRVKVKFAEYLRLHKLLTGISPKTIWEMLRDELPLDSLTANVPEDFRQWVANWNQRLVSHYVALETAAQRHFAGQPVGDRKTIAEYFKQKPELCSILFSMLDGKSYDEAIWRMCRPKVGPEDVFKKDTER